jgi:uncharacterized membrane protein
MIFAAIPFGPLAICVAGTIYTHIAVVINTYYTGKLFGLGYIKQVKDFSHYIICSLFSVIPAVLLLFTNIPNILLIILGVILSGMIYFILLRKDPHMKEALNWIKAYLSGQANA